MPRTQDVLKFLQKFSKLIDFLPEHGNVSEKFANFGGYHRNGLQYAQDVSANAKMRH